MAVFQTYLDSDDSKAKCHDSQKKSAGVFQKVTTLRIGWSSGWVFVHPSKPSVQRTYGAEEGDQVTSSHLPKQGSKPTKRIHGLVWCTMIFPSAAPWAWYRGTVSESYPNQIQICTRGHAEALQNYALIQRSSKVPRCAQTQQSINSYQLKSCLVYTCILYIYI